VVSVYDEYCLLTEELADSKELFQEVGDDPEMKEMAREEIKGIEPKLERVGRKYQAPLATQGSE
jgi:protein subunit release factor A